MKEAKEYKAYELLKNEYEKVGIDYVILSLDGEYEGAETHKKAIVDAFDIFNKRFGFEDDGMHVNTDKMIATKSTLDELLKLPTDSFYDNKQKRNRSYSVPKPMPYWFAFLEPPHGNPYQISDFIRFNDILFSDKEAVEVYSWNDDFSDYFDAGKEWWGTGLWTAFDASNGVVIVIGASLTD